MQAAIARQVSDARRPIPLPRLVAGVLIHFCVPAYLLTCLIAGLVVTPRVATAADIPARMLWTGAWFVPAYLMMTLIGAAAAALIEPRLQPPVTDAVAFSRADLAGAAQSLAGSHDRRLTAALTRIDAVRWEHGDPRDQRLSADLARAAHTFAAALASAGPAQRLAVLTLAGDSVERLATAAETLAEERRRLDQGDAQTVAGYLKVRYGD